MQSHNGRALEAQVGLEVLSDLADQALEGQLADEQLGGFLVTADLAQSHGTGPVTVRLLDASGGRGALTGSLSGELLPGGFAASRLASGLLGSCHCFSLFFSCVKGRFCSKQRRLAALKLLGAERPEELVISYVIMPPYAPLSFASNFSNLWVRLKYIGDGDPPTRDYVAEELILQTSWLNVQDIYSFIALPSKRDFELCFTEEAPLRRFLEISLSNASHPKWKDWQVESSVQVEVVTLVVKFWTGRIPDQDIELYLKRYCEILQPPVKPVDKFGFWYGVRKYKVRMRRDEAGHIISIPNSISLGPYNGRIIYPGQSVRCFICQGPDHQARECPTVKCWKCGELGHKAKICQNESECSLCGAKGHTFFKCPKGPGRELTGRGGHKEILFFLILI
uniref:CCHC-type domain-containing protein n=1 Tax=Maylandia zebra TaxID=106582 RepID=A0A3P9D2W9_9CICH